MINILLIIAQIMQIFLGCWMFKMIFPDLQIKHGIRAIAAVLVLGLMVYLQGSASLICYVSYGQLLVVGVLGILVSVLMLEDIAYAASAFWWFYCMSMELLKVPCLIFRGILYEETLFWANYGARIWLEVIWSGILILAILLLGINRKKYLIDVKRLLEKHPFSVVSVGVVEWLLFVLVIWLGGSDAFTTSTLLAVFLGIISIVLLCLHLLVKMLWQETASERNIMLVSKELFLRHHEGLKEVYAKNNQRLHDTKHMVLYLKNSISEHRLEDAMSQLEKFEKSIQNVQKIVWTGFDFPDFMINTKKVLMDEIGIRFRLDVDLTHIPVDDAEIGVILGNLLDNAIEAAKKCEPEKREIYLKMCNRNEMFYLRMHNSSTHLPMLRNGKFVSSKQGDVHGYGIENVKTLVEQYQGSIDFQYDKTFFEVTILI